MPNKRPFRPILIPEIRNEESSLARDTRDSLRLLISPLSFLLPNSLYFVRANWMLVNQPPRAIIVCVQSGLYFDLGIRGMRHYKFEPKINK